MSLLYLIAKFELKSIIILIESETTEAVDLRGEVKYKRDNGLEFNNENENVVDEKIQTNEKPEEEESDDLRLNDKKSDEKKPEQNRLSLARFSAGITLGLCSFLVELP